jgi:hypothetical protein
MTKVPNLVLSELGIWSFEDYKRQMDVTNYSAHGKALSSSLRLPDQEHMS